MEVQFHGSLRERFGATLLMSLPPRGCSVAELRTRLAAEHPDMGPAITTHSLRACVDDRIVGEDHLVSDDQSIEFFPPLSGG